MLQEKKLDMSTIAEAIAEAWACHQAGQLQEAVWRYDRVLQSAPSRADVWYLRGAACQMLERIPEAIECYQQALRLQPHFAEVYGNLGVAYKVQGHIADAIASYRAAIRVNPSLPASYNNLGLALADEGNLNEAVANFQEALRLKADFPEAHYNLGKALQQQGKLDEAIVSYRRALELYPAYTPACNNLGVALTAQGKLEDAETALRQALALDPANPDVHNNLGNLFSKQGRPSKAIACYRRALQILPDDADAYNNLGLALADQAQLGRAAACFREAIRCQSSFPEAYFNLGKVLVNREQLEEAADCFRQAVRCRPEYPEAHSRLSAVLQMLDRPEAAAHFQEALRLRPHFPEAHYMNGLALQRIGDMAGAETALRETLRQDPRHVDAYAELAALLRGRLPETDFVALSALLADPALSDAERVRLHFALTQVHDARGEYMDAAGQAQCANALQQTIRHQRGTGYDPAAHKEFVDRLIGTFSPEFFDRVRGWGLDSELPVFVFGLPRSGTTLVEQILASHAQVHGAGELSLCQDVVDSLMGDQDDAGAFAALVRIDPQTFHRLATQYLEQLQALGGSSARVVDKMPDNYQYLGLLVTMFPRARFIHCRRDVRDIALSCWTTGFAQLNWANDPQSIASRIRDYRRLMDHWRRVLPVSMLEVSYEAIVADLETEARWLLARCGLPWEPACLDFHTTSRPVNTASATQVRQPLYARSIGRWQHYAVALGSLFALLDAP
jgi:tetratricopeptide (TPR) repeat protein